ncbi:hypothetical protein LXL04_012205 [Taraxacum kok-saghyz]
MANNQFIIIITTILLSLAFHSATATTNTTTNTNADHEVATRYDDDMPMVVVEGKVYCQTCGYNRPPWSTSRSGWSLSGFEPIRGARVRVICKNYKRRVSFYSAFSTDRKGYFYAELKNFKMNHLLLDHPLHACYVKLLSSPLDRCDIVSNMNNGIKGARLRFEDKVTYGRGYDQTVIYAAGPLAFRPSDCYPERDPIERDPFP